MLETSQMAKPDQSLLEKPNPLSYGWLTFVFSGPGIHWMLEKGFWVYQVCLGVRRPLDKFHPPRPHFSTRQLSEIREVFWASSCSCLFWHMLWSTLKSPPWFYLPCYHLSHTSSLLLVFDSGLGTNVGDTHLFLFTVRSVIFQEKQLLKHNSCLSNASSNRQVVVVFL